MKIEQQTENKPILMLESDLITQKNTEVYHEHPDEIKFNAPHHFKVWAVEENGVVFDKNLLAEINFQEGIVKENGKNGIHNEDLLAMVICRLEGFQNSEYKCKENAIVIMKLEECLMWLRKRTNKRVQHGVEGTSTV